MTWRSPCRSITTLFCVMLVVLTLTAATADAGIVERVKSARDYAKGIVEGALGLVKEGMNGNIDSETYNRRVDEFFHRKRDEGIETFLKDVTDRIKLKVSTPLEGLKKKLADTLLGRAVASVKEKIQAATTGDAGSDVAEPDEQYGAIDPRIALDVNEEETKWYQAETGILDETPLPQEKFAAHGDENFDESPDSDWTTYSEVDEQNGYIQRDCENDWAGCPNDSSNQKFQANTHRSDLWSARSDGADEWGGHSSQDCRNEWGDIRTGIKDSTDCREEDQKSADLSYEADISNDPDDAQDTQDGNYTEALDVILDNKATPSYDMYSASSGSYQEALAVHEAQVAAETPSSTGPTRIPDVQRNSPAASRACQETPTCRRVVATIKMRTAPIQARFDAGGMGISETAELTAKMLKVFLDHAPACYTTETRPQCITAGQKDLAEARRVYESALETARQARGR